MISYLSDFFGNVSIHSELLKSLSRDLGTHFFHFNLCLSVSIQTFDNNNIENSPFETGKLF